MSAFYLPYSSTFSRIDLWSPLKDYPITVSSSIFVVSYLTNKTICKSHFGQYCPWKEKNHWPGEIELHQRRRHQLFWDYMVFFYIFPEPCRILSQYRLCLEISYSKWRRNQSQLVLFGGSGLLWCFQAWYPHGTRLPYPCIQVRHKAI